MTRRQRLILVAVALTAMTTAVSVGLFHKIALLTHTEQIIEDIRTVALRPREPQDDKIVIVAITEDTLAQFPYRSPVDRAFLSRLLQTLAQRGAKVIGIDVLFDQPTEADKDAALKSTLATLPVPLVVSYTDNPHILDEDQQQFLNDFVPPKLRALAELAPDPIDDAVRWIFPGDTVRDGSYMLGFARAVATRLGLNATPRRPDFYQPMVWHGQPDRDTTAFRVYPAHTVPVLPAEWFAGKIVLIGEIVSLTDRHRTPFSTVYRSRGDMAGVEIHANAVSQIIERRRSGHLGFGGELAIVTLVAGLGVAFGMINRRLARHVVLGVTTLGLLWSAGFLLLHVMGLIIPVVEPTAALLLAMWSSDAISGRDARRQREFIQSAFARYLNPHYVRQLASNPGLLKLGGEMREMTLMFCDIRGFTTLSERFNAHDLTRFLNSFLTPMTTIIRDAGGTVDKYMGDAIMAFWNAPLEDPAHAENACRAALAMRGELARLNARWQADAAAQGELFDEVKIGIGLNTGECCVGNLGSDQQFNYSVIGDDVNLCSRLEGQTKTYGVDIVIGEKTAAEAPAFATIELDLIRVKGKTRPVHIYALIGDETAAIEPALSALTVQHDAMLGAYRARNWAEARARLRACRAQAPHSLQALYDLYGERIAAFEADPPPADWDGVFVALTK